ncbi:MAG: arginine--tRNA ligase [Dehalococcoidia bacterium]|nr:arginine--tRNA ligase [Dehalococcoidia bacterium]
MELSLVKNKIAALIEHSLREAQERDLLPKVLIPEVLVEHPQNPEHGDYATSLPLKLARSMGMNPMAIGEKLAGVIQAGEEIEKIEVIPPGFINFVLKSRWLTSQVETITDQGQSFGSVNIGDGKRVQIEFVSVNPTGPLHVGHGRGAILGNVLASVMGAAGFNVEKEYYINDAGAQIDAFKNSLFVRYQQSRGIPAEMPPNAYLGDYMKELADRIAGEDGNKYLDMSVDKAVPLIGEKGLGYMLEWIREDLKLLGVEFDNWFSERTLYQQGQYERAMAIIKEKGFIAKKEGATWFVSTALGEDKDNVLIRGDGTPTYFASDIAYHYDKFIVRGFDRVINIWGADHQGHVPRMKAAASALDINADRLKIIISQMVSLKRQNEIVKVSKRSGELITLKEVIEEVGADACIFFFLSRTADSQMDFDLDLAKEQSDENPVYYVQYAYARICSILRLAEEKGISFQDGDVSLLVHPAEQALIRKMVLLPEIVEMVARGLEPHHLPYYSQELATFFHSFYKQCRVITDDMPLSKARLKLVQAAGVVLSRTLRLMGMTAPERM